MILYTNGNGHASAAMATNNFIFAKDDKSRWSLGDSPHPDNIAASWGATIARTIKYSFLSEAKAGNTTNDIIESTKRWLTDNAENIDNVDILLIIQWGEWETIDDDFKMIVEFHKFLVANEYIHIFCNSNKSFFDIAEQHRYDFGSNFISPYLNEKSFVGFVQNSGYFPVANSNKFYGRQAHAAWGNEILKYIRNNNII